MKNSDSIYPKKNLQMLIEYTPLDQYTYTFNVFVWYIRMLLPVYM